MGTVYLAQDTRLQRQVALKFLAAEHIASPDAGDGRDRRHRGPDQDALNAAHAANIVHRDLKPANLMLTPTGGVKVLDFGIARIDTEQTGTQLTLAGTAMGTAAYMSPEQAAGEIVDRRSDVWSLGVVTYEMVTGRLPFDGSNALSRIHAVLTSTPAPVKTLRPDVAPELEGIVNRALVRDRDERTISAAEVHDLATACYGRLSSGSRVIAGHPRGWRWQQVAAVFAAAVLLASGAAWWARRNAEIRWARNEALPQIIQLAGTDKFDQAFALAQRARTVIPDDPLLAEQWRSISRTATVTSDPAGADVFYRPYGHSDEPWRSLGPTPITGAIVPRGLLRWKAEMEGRQVAEDVGPGPFDQPRLHFTLFPEDQVPAGMVRIASASPAFRVSIPGLDG
jgi:eukaryotic-like serine/threonine-protein kinase